MVALFKLDYKLLKKIEIFTKGYRNIPVTHDATIKEFFCHILEKKKIRRLFVKWFQIVLI